MSLAHSTQASRTEHPVRSTNNHHPARHEPRLVIEPQRVRSHLMKAMDESSRRLLAIVRLESEPHNHKQTRAYLDVPSGDGMR